MAFWIDRFACTCEGVPHSELEETSRYQPMAHLGGTALALALCSSRRLTMSTRRYGCLTRQQPKSSSRADPDRAKKQTKTHTRFRYQFAHFRTIFVGGKKSMWKKKCETPPAVPGVVRSPKALRKRSASRIGFGAYACMRLFKKCEQKRSSIKGTSRFILRVV